MRCRAWPFWFPVAARPVASSGRTGRFRPPRGPVEMVQDEVFDHINHNVDKIIKSLTQPRLLVGCILDEGKVITKLV